MEDPVFNYLILIAIGIIAWRFVYGFLGHLSVILEGTFEAMQYVPNPQVVKWGRRLATALFVYQIISFVSVIDESC